MCVCVCVWKNHLTPSAYTNTLPSPSFHEQVLSLLFPPFRSIPCISSKRASLVLPSDTSLSTTLGAS